MVSGPGMARLTGEYQACQEQIRHTKNSTLDNRHREQPKAVQVRFMTQVDNLCEIIDEMGSPFEERSDDLLVLDTNDIEDKSIAESV